MTEKLLTEAELAERLTVKVGTLQEWRRLKKGPAYVKIGGAVRYVTADVDAWVERQRVQHGKG